MARVTSNPASPASIPQPPSPVRLDVAPAAPPTPPDFTHWAPELPTTIRQACLAYVHRRLPIWLP